MKQLAEQLFDHIIKMELTPLLRAKGFSKRAGKYWLDKDGFSYLVQIERHKYLGSISFTFSCGVYVCGVFEEFLGMKEKKNPDVAHCVIRTRIGRLFDKQVDHWWEINSDLELNRDYQAIVEDIVLRFHRCVFPFLSRFDTVSKIAEFLGDKREERDKIIMPRNLAISFAYAAVLYSRLGEQEKCQSLFDDAIAIQQMNGVASTLGMIKGLRERICRH